MSRIFGMVSPFLEAHQFDSMNQAASRGNHVTSSLIQKRLHNVFMAGTSPGSSLAYDEHVICVVDGYFYNRTDLSANQSEAEIFVHLFRKYGFEKSLQKLNGDFAISLFEDQTLWLARDRFGIRPLYYIHRGNRIAFASRIASLRALSWGIGTVNHRYVSVFAGSHYRAFDNAPAETPFLDISQVPARSYVKISANHISIKAYWDLAESSDVLGAEAVLAEQYAELLKNAVSIRLSRIKFPSFTLSGGLDSSSVLSLALHATGRKYPAFSSVYRDITYDESAEIQPMIPHACDPWTPVLVDIPDIMQTVSAMVTSNDEPIATATWLSHFELCRHVHNAGHSALFGGLGGDELNAGEYEYFTYHFADLLKAGNKSSFHHEVEHWARYHNHPVFRKDENVAKENINRLTDTFHAGRCLPDLSRLLRYEHVINRDYFDLAKFTLKMDSPFTSYLRNRCYQDIFRETAPCCLRAAERHTQSFGIDAIWPFFDHRLVEWMFRIPGHLKIRDGVTKILLREAMKGILPEETRTRIKKTGWNAPAHQWFSGSSKSKSALLDLVRSKKFIERGIYHPQHVEALIHEHDEIVRSQKPQENHMMFLWQLVNLELWFQICVEQHTTCVNSTYFAQENLEMDPMSHSNDQATIV